MTGILSLVMDQNSIDKVASTAGAFSATEVFFWVVVFRLAFPLEEPGPKFGRHSEKLL